MVAREDLHATPGARLAAMIDETTVAAQQGATTPAGVIDLGDNGDVAWRNANQEPISVKALPSLIDTKLAEGLATDNKRNTVSTNQPGNVIGYPDGAYWVQITSANDQTVLGVWKLVAGVWQSQPVPSAGLVAPTIDAGLINVAVLAAKLITSGEFRTSVSPDGVYSIMDPQGFRVVDMDGPGGGSTEPVDLIRLGPVDNNLLQIGQVMITDDGSVSGKTGSFESVMVAGRNINTVISDAVSAGGIRAAIEKPHGQRSNVYPDNNTKPLMTMTFDVAPGEVIKLETNTCTAYVTGSGAPLVSMHVSTAAKGTTPADPTTTDFWGTRRASAEQPNVSNAWVTLPGLSHFVENQDATPVTVMVSYCLRPGGVGATIQSADQAISMLATMQGNRVASRGTVDLYTPVYQTFTKRYESVDWITYLRGGGSGSIAVEKPSQGLFPGSNNRQTAWFFPNMLPDIQTASRIRSIKLRTYFDTWEWPSGFGEFRLHGVLGKTAYPTVWNPTDYKIAGTVADWPRNCAREWNVDPADFAGFQSGRWRGFYMATDNTSPALAGILTTWLPNTWIEVVYDKQIN